MAQNLVPARRRDRVDGRVGQEQGVGDYQVAAIEPTPNPGLGLAAGQRDGRRGEGAHSATRPCVINVHVLHQLAPVDQNELPLTISGKR